MIFQKFNKKIIFVIGSGRSGTHLLGRTFEKNEEIDAFIEEENFFFPIAQMAVGGKDKTGLKKIFKQYKKVFSKSKKEYILEKTHPNIWFVEDLAEYFPEAKFIGIKRNVFATVSSMLQHEGVLSWYKRLPLDQVNPFLGITEVNKNDFADLPLESKCALRWKSHSERLDALAVAFPEKVLVIDYEEFYNEYEPLMDKLKTFLKAPFSIQSEPLNNEGHLKWKTHLSEEQINLIKNAVK